MYIDLERCSKAVQQITHKGHRFSVTRGSKIIVCVHITHAITAGPASGQDDGHMSVGVLPSFQASHLPY